MRILFFLILLLFSLQNFAQRPATGTWLTLQLPVQLNSKWQIHNDGGYRTLGNSITPLQYFYRTGLRYNISKNLSAAAGVAFFFTRTTFSKQNDEFGREFRFWEELNYKTNLSKKTQWQTRLRIEQRNYAATSNKAAYHAFRYRIRTQLQQKIAAKWTAVLAGEYMQQYARSNWAFDQNRLILNGIYTFNKHTQLQGGYMWVRWPANSSQHLFTLLLQKTITLNAKG
ncbi:MAG: hypothetical protein RIR31_776 [Bacteroidota bacterium]